MGIRFGNARGYRMVVKPQRVTFYMSEAACAALLELSGRLGRSASAIVDYAVLHLHEEDLAALDAPEEDSAKRS